MKLINVQTSLDTKGIITVEFGKALIVSFSKDIDYQVVESAGTIAGVVADDDIYKKVEAFFSGNRRQSTVSVAGKICDDAAAVKAYLDEIISTYKDFYFVLQDTFDLVKSKAKNEWCVSNNLFPWDLTPTTLAIADLEAYATSNNDLASIIDGNNNEDAIFVGYASTFTPGYLPWSWRELQGVTPTTRSTSDQVKMLDVNVNFINEERRGLYVTVPGKTTFGEFIKNEWGKANMNDDLHIAVANLLKSANPPAHPGADMSAATSFDQVCQEVINDYASSTRRFIANWSATDAEEAGKQVGTPKAWVKTKTDYTENEIKTGVFSISWAAMPRGECLSGTVNGILTFNESTILSEGE